MADKFCRDCRHFRDLRAEQAASLQADAGFWGRFSLPPPPAPPIFAPHRCQRQISPVTGAPAWLDAEDERGRGGCGPAGQFWAPKA